MSSNTRASTLFASKYTPESKSGNQETDKLITNCQYGVEKLFSRGTDEDSSWISGPPMSAGCSDLSISSLYSSLYRVGIVGDKDSIKTVGVLLNLSPTPPLSPATVGTSYVFLQN